jgi:hypothetical protein
MERVTQTKPSSFYHVKGKDHKIQIYSYNPCSVCKLNVAVVTEEQEVSEKKELKRIF